MILPNINNNVPIHFEALIIMIASGSVGVIVGGLTGWLVTSNFALFSDTPNTFVFPYINILLISVIYVLYILRINGEKSISLINENISN